MLTVFIVRRAASLARSTQARLETSRDLCVQGVADSLFRARAGLAPLDPDALLIDLRLEDGAALSLVRELRQDRRHRGERPRIMLVAGRPDDPLLFATLMAGADAYLLEADLGVAASALQRMAAGEASMAPAVALQVLNFFREEATSSVTAAEDRRLDWSLHAADPTKLSPGELRMVQLVAGGARSAELAVRFGISLEAVGRRIANVYRKLSWDVRRGALSLKAA